MPESRQTLKSASQLDTGREKQKRIDKFVNASKERKKAILNKRRKSGNQSNSISIDLYLNNSQAINELVLSLNDSITSVRVSALKKCRMVLGVNQQDNEHVEELVTQFLLNNDFIPLLIKNLKSFHSECQLEAAWCITNIASSHHEHTKETLHAIPDLINFCDGRFCDNAILQEQCSWALGNIAGDCAEYCRLLVRNGALTPLFSLFKTSKVVDVVKTAAWCLHNISRGVMMPGDSNQHYLAEQGWPNDRYLSMIFDQSFINTLLKCCKDASVNKCNLSVLHEVMWVLSNLSRLSDYGVMTSKLIQPRDESVTLLDDVIQIIISAHDDYLMIPCLRVLGNLLKGPDVVAETAISRFDALVSNKLPLLIKFKNVASKEAAWVISNLCAASDWCIDELMKRQYLILLYTCARDVYSSGTVQDWIVCREIAISVCNLCSGCRVIQNINEVVLLLLNFLQDSTNYVDNEDVQVIESVCFVLNFVDFLLSSSTMREQVKAILLHNNGSSVLQNIQKLNRCECIQVLHQLNNKLNN
ncbi:importin subunit alpha-6/7 [Acrasis kona]|uniref:Importin subunit alpha-6/7 n=1 Tax=Acrasis kona TaxID=1008807 RepID=A0AAW2YYW3_9EUKA